jgi:hypothetical protein
MIMRARTKQNRPKAKRNTPKRRAKPSKWAKLMNAALCIAPGLIKRIGEYYEQKGRHL